MADEDSTTPKLDDIKVMINDYTKLAESIAVIDGVEAEKEGKAAAEYANPDQVPKGDPDAPAINPLDGSYASAAVITRCIRGLINAGAIEGDASAIWSEEDPPVDEA